MFEKVNPFHPDKVADRIAGAIVDLCYKLEDNPKVAVEVLLGHGYCSVIIETSSPLNEGDIKSIVTRINGECEVKTLIVPQDIHLSSNQDKLVRCGDNGIFRGCPVTKEQKELTDIAKTITRAYPFDGKYILNGNKATICQSHLIKSKEAELLDCLEEKNEYLINPIGEWTGGSNVDSGATNRKLGSDMGDAVTGGGLHGKDLSKADVSVNIYAHIMAHTTGKPYEAVCSIGDEYIDGRPYSEIVKIARTYIDNIGGFEKFAEWGLIR